MSLARLSAQRPPALRLRGRNLNMSGPSCSLAAGPDGLSDGCKGAPLVPGAKLPIPGTESIMSAKAHGTCATPVQQRLRWGCDIKLADRICWRVPPLCELHARASADARGAQLQPALR